MFNGIPALKIAQEICPEVPFIFVSETMGEELVIEALKQGATDCVFKTRLSRIAPSVRRALREADERSQRKRAEEELQQLVDLVPQLLVVLAPDGKWIHANRVAREYTGLTLDEYRSVDLIGKVIHPADAEKMRPLRERALSETDPFELEARLLGKDGNYRWFLFRYNPLVEQGNVRRWYASATEIESRKKEEDRVRKENVRLEERTRIGQELHDTLSETFLSATLDLNIALPPNNCEREECVKLALESHPEIAEACAMVKNASAGVRAAKREYIPASRPLPATVTRTIVCRLSPLTSERSVSTLATTCSMAGKNGQCLKSGMHNLLSRKRISSASAMKSS